MFLELWKLTDGSGRAPTRKSSLVSGAVWTFPCVKCRNGDQVTSTEWRGLAAVQVVRAGFPGLLPEHRGSKTGSLVQFLDIFIATDSSAWATLVLEHMLKDLG